MPIDRISPSASRQFEELALAIDVHAGLPLDDQLTSNWILQVSDDAARAREFGEYWWLYISVGCMHLLDTSAVPVLSSWMRPSLPFNECISGLQQALAHLITLAGATLLDARDGMTLARSKGRIVTTPRYLPPSVTWTQPTPEFSQEGRG